MKLSRLIILSMAVLAAANSASAQKSLYKLDVGDFSELKVSDAINVEYNCSTDSAGWAYFECDPATAQLLMFTNNKNKLNIQIATSENGLPKELPTIRVYSMTLQKVENVSDSTLKVGRTLPVRDFKATLVGNGALVITNIQCHNIDASIKTGNGHLVVNGTTRRAGLKNVGTGTLEASGLKAEEVKCSILGTGPIDCNASAALTISGAGSGKVYYGGTPSKITNRSIGVKAYSMDTKQEIK
ncbi:MAG: DUF2807 domain-containing protein [Muribaculaceae bacterium]|nr:DUF2807 domain-containing protein [Muribaculaceae bacterium]